MHALARRLQRGADGSTEALVADMALVGEAASGDAVVGAGYRVRTAPDGGGWRGWVINMAGRDGVPQAVLSTRTWMS